MIKTADYIYQTLVAAFCVIVVVSNIISAKFVQLPFDLILPAGLITYPLTFLLTDLVTEVFGAKKSQVMVYIALGMNLLGFALIELALWLPSAEGIDSQLFQAVLGLSGLRIFASLLGYIVSQIVDIQLYSWIKTRTGDRLLWLRNNASTCFSQLLDTLIIDLIYLYGGLGMEWSAILPIMLFSYLYKAFFSLGITPLFYFSVSILRSLISKDLRTA